MRQSPPNLLKEVTERIRESPLRMTRKRERIIGALLTFDRPAAATEVRDRAGLPDSDLVTVYRTMEAFEGVGVIQSIPLENGTHLFELTRPGDHHHHFVCRCCHRTERFDRCLKEELEEEAESLGFTAISHVMEVYGLCSECSAAEPPTR
jgi:Fe2+ or Zn2+ uptake regulation protein